MSSYTIGLIIQSCVSVITVCGVFILTGLAGMTSFGQAAYMAVGAYVTFILAASLQIPLVIACIIGVVAAGLVTLIIGIPTLKLRKVYFALVSIGISQAMSALIITMKDVTKGALGFSRIPKVKNLMWIALAIMALVIWMVWNFKSSRFGRMCIALKNDELAAKGFGIDVYHLKIKAYILASVFAAVGGILYGAQVRILEPYTFGWNLSSEMVIFLFFGGTNSLTGSVVSAFLLKYLPEMLRQVTIFGIELQEFRTVIYCILIIIILNFRPQGLFGEYEFSFRGTVDSLKKLAAKRERCITGEKK